ncbi:putative NAD dependent epimerase/dehydratase [Aspergillus ruber CBS 135680]|uniref:Putative NAD dependent epimerase/dehydratase n=1 Tax=Aspergillus ruber (strain CBS 135680) TaxID=1388766 RepID=A0A017S699_ASPRC|nr:putative NAD dependent epimerase/dehydratase [Aspergillus ruber CBS 135680]EYE91685.1 putative NAD dependent epimerase/dehydratase [Aspergillus ruber CBS 135680]
MTRIFMTGASGYIGSVVVEQAIPKGYQIYALSRSEASDEKIKAQGAVPIRGDLKSYDVLREQSAQADIVLHLADAYAGNFGMDYADVVRIDNAAVDAIGAGLEGSNKPLVITSGTLVESALWDKPLNDRISSEQHAMKLVNKGIKVSAVRLSPFVYGRGASGVRLFMMMFANGGEVFYVNNGDVKTSAVHVDDAATLFILAAEKANVGDIFNATSINDVTTREISEAIGSILDLPVKSFSYDDTVSKFGEFLARFLNAENQPSGAKAKSQLGWDPKGLSIIDDIKIGSYVAVAEGLKKPVA